MFAVTHPEHFHYMNMQQYPAHYPLHARLFGSSYVAKVENLGPGVWFNAYVPMGGVVSLSMFISSSFLCGFTRSTFSADSILDTGMEQVHPRYFSYLSLLSNCPETDPMQFIP